jgi:regulator of replication initiation timing
LAAENEKLRAQMVALREQAAAAEDARRQARLAAENAAAERDEYREQAEELQQQLKEVMHVCGACWGCGLVVGGCRELWWGLVQQQS